MSGRDSRLLVEAGRMIDAKVALLSYQVTQRAEAIIRYHFRETPLYLQAMFDTGVKPKRVEVQHVAGGKLTPSGGYQRIYEIRVVER